MRKAISCGLSVAVAALLLALPVRVDLRDGGLDIGVADCVAQGSCKPADDWVCNLNGSEDYEDKCRVGDCDD